MPKPGERKLQILQTLAAARRAGALVCVHAEHHELITWLTQALLAAGQTAPRHLAWAKPMMVEREAETLCGKRQRQFAADAAGSAGDEGDGDTSVRAGEFGWEGHGAPLDCQWGGLQAT